MLKDMKTVGVLLLLSAISAGTAYAVPKWGTAGVKEIQQNGVCNGVVTDTTGETVIGASVVVKGTTMVQLQVSMETFHYQGLLKEVYWLFPLWVIKIRK